MIIQEDLRPPQPTTGELCEAAYREGVSHGSCFASNSLAHLLRDKYMEVSGLTDVVESTKLGRGIAEMWRSQEGAGMSWATERQAMLSMCDRVEAGVGEVAVQFNLMVRLRVLFDKLAKREGQMKAVFEEAVRDGPKKEQLGG